MSPTDRGPHGAVSIIRAGVVGPLDVAGTTFDQYVPPDAVLAHIDFTITDREAI